MLWSRCVRLIWTALLRLISIPQNANHLRAKFPTIFSRRLLFSSDSRQLPNSSASKEKRLKLDNETSKKAITAPHQ
jgi:hypothetical protein